MLKSIYISETTDGTISVKCVPTYLPRYDIESEYFYSSTSAVHYPHFFSHFRHVFGLFHVVFAMLKAVSLSLHIVQDSHSYDVCVTDQVSAYNPCIFFGTR